MADWENFNEKALPEKEEFHSNLNIEDMHGKRVFKDLK